MAPVVLPPGELPLPGEVVSADTIVGGVLISLSLCALVTAAVCVVITRGKATPPAESVQQRWDREIDTILTDRGIPSSTPIFDALMADELRAELNDDAAVSEWLRGAS